MISEFCGFCAMETQTHEIWVKQHNLSAQTFTQYKKLEDCFCGYGVKDQFSNFG